MDWSDMPEELLDMILSNLFAKDRDTFSVICRSWNKVVSASPYINSPCLVFSNRDSHIQEVFQYNAFFSIDFPIKNAAIHCSKHGWLLMSGNYGTLFFFDPFNDVEIELPDYFPESYTTISFFNPPTSPDCFIIGVESEEEFEVEIGLLRHGEDKWSTYYFKRRIDFKPSFAHPILHDEKLYFLDVRGNIATIDMKRDIIVKSAYVHNNCLKTRRFKSPYVYSKCLKQRRLRRDIKEHYLVKPKGEDTIFAVFAMHNGRNIKVFRLLKEMVWEPVTDLGDKVFYVSALTSFGYTTHDKSLRNKIFFSKFYGDKVVFYSLDTQKYHSFEGDYSSENSYDFSRFDHATWMMHAPTTQHRAEHLTWY